MNQTVTVNGFAVTLERIEFTAQGMNVYASSGLLPTTTQNTLIRPPVTIIPPFTTGGTTPQSSATASGTGGGTITASQPDFTPVLPPQPDLALAEYSIDGGDIERAAASSAIEVDGRLEQVWDNLHPVSKNARQITFTIIWGGRLQGSWVFVINLT